MVKFDWSKITRVGDSFKVTVPMKVFQDQNFPFKEGEDVIVEIEKDKLVIRRP